MSVIPFGIIGALLGHYIVGISVSILSLFGILALSGIVVNDSLVLMHRVDDLLRSGRTLREAVLIAGPQRFRAILLPVLLVVHQETLGSSFSFYKNLLNPPASETEPETSEA